MFQTDSKEKEEVLSLLCPMNVALEEFFRSRAKDFNVSISINREKRVIRYRGSKAEDITLTVSGTERREYMADIEKHLEDFLEASGFF